MKDPDFRDAPWRIVLIHIPTISHIEPWYAQQWLCDNMLPILNEAGVNLMLSGHHHKYIFVTPHAEGNGNDFPILVNSNVDRLDFTATDSLIDIRIVDLEGKEIHRHSFRK